MENVNPSAYLLNFISRIVVVVKDPVSGRMDKKDRLPHCMEQPYQSSHSHTYNP